MLTLDDSCYSCWSVLFFMWHKAHTFKICFMCIPFKWVCSLIFHDVHDLRLFANIFKVRWLQSTVIANIHTLHVYFMVCNALRHLPDGLAVRIPGSHPGGPGSTPGQGARLFQTSFSFLGCRPSTSIQNRRRRRASHERSLPPGSLVFGRPATRGSPLWDG